MTRRRDSSTFKPSEEQRIELLYDSVFYEMVEVDPRNWTSAEERVLPIKED